MADAQEGGDERVDFFGNFRMRLEQDWDSLRGNGTRRDDRLRLRVRLRLGLGLKLNDSWSMRVQARTGSHQSQQSPHITIHDFDGGPDGPYEGNLDLWYVSYASGGLDLWAGRNELSFWHQDDLFIYDNVTYAGAGGSYRHSLAGGQLTWHLNYVALPVGMRDFSGTAFVAQVAWEREYSGRGFTAAAGFVASNAGPDDPAGSLLLTENNTRDYRVFNLELHHRSRLFGLPLKVGADWSHNTRDYTGAPPDSFSAFHADDVDGFAVLVEWGARARAGDWLLGYFYSYQEALATHSSYVQDDWVRWGNADQTRATNLKGSEVRAVYTIRPNMNIFARAFFVHAIDLLEPGDTTKETGNRFRIDYNISF